MQGAIFSRIIIPFVLFIIIPLETVSAKNLLVTEPSQILIEQSLVSDAIISDKLEAIQAEVLTPLGVSLELFNKQELSFSDKLFIDYIDTDHFNSAINIIEELGANVKTIEHKTIKIHDLFKIYSHINIILNDKAIKEEGMPLQATPEEKESIENIINNYNKYRFTEIEKFSDLIKGYFLLQQWEARTSILDLSDYLKHNIMLDGQELVNKHDLLITEIKKQYQMTINPLTQDEIQNLSHIEKYILTVLNFSQHNNMLAQYSELFTRFYHENNVEFISTASNIRDILRLIQALILLENSQAEGINRTIKGNIPTELSLQEFSELRFLSPDTQEIFNDLKATIENSWNCDISDLNVNTLSDFGKHLIEESNFFEMDNKLTTLAKTYNLRWLPGEQHQAYTLGKLFSLSGEELVEIHLKLEVIRQSIESYPKKIQIPEDISIEDFFKMEYLNLSDAKDYKYANRHSRKEDYPFLHRTQINGFKYADNISEAEVDMYINPKIKTNEARKIAVFIHGGGYHGGDKIIAFYNNAGLIQKLVDKGFAVFAINHRVLVIEKNVTLDIADIVADVHTFFLQLYETKEMTVDGQSILLDSDNIYAWGESSGGYLSTMLPHLQKEGQSIIKKVAALYPLTGDVYDAFRYAQGFSSIYHNMNIFINNIVSHTGDQYEFSPINHIDKINNDVEILLLHAYDDEQNNIMESTRYYTQAKQHGLNIKVNYDAYGNHDNLLGERGEWRDNIFEFFTNTTSISTTITEP